MRRPQAAKSEVQAKDFILEVLGNLLSHGAGDEAIPLVLRKICAYFSFGCAFVYECDHTKAFFLKEHCQAYPHDLPASFRLENALGEEGVRQLSSAPVICVSREIEVSEVGAKLAKLFAGNTLLLVPVADADGSAIGCVGIADRRADILIEEADIALARTLFEVVASRIAQRIYRQRLHFTQMSLEGIMDNTGIDIYVNDFDTHEILYVNRSMAAPYGGIQNMMGRLCWEALYEGKTGECDYCPKHRLLDEQGNPTKTYSWDYQRPFDGAWFRVISAAFRWVDGRIAHVISSVDITENKRNEALVKRMAFYDTLTGIPNRRKLESDFAQFITGSGGAQPATLMFLDLDDFKAINDTFSHAVGDELLTKVASFLQEESTAKGHAYRHGGDEFILFLPGGAWDIAETTAHLLDAFSRGWEISGRLVYCRASIGIAQYPRDGVTYQALLDSADHAMYTAKRDGKDRAAFSKDV